jgi:hypothetical protein
MAGVNGVLDRLARARRRSLALAAFPVMAALLTSAAACGGSAQGLGGTAAASTAAAGGKLTVLSASFISPATAWALATPCADEPGTCKTVEVRKTADGGRAWTAVAAPPASPADQYQGRPPSNAVGKILFTGARTGYAFGSSLWRTVDGARSWHRIPLPAGELRAFAPSGSLLLAVMTRCGSGGSNCRAQIYERGAGAAGGAAFWRALPGADGPTDGPTGEPSGTVGADSVALVASGGAGYGTWMSPGGVEGKPVLVGGPANGSKPWHRVTVPCVAFTTALNAAGGWLFFGCGGEPGAGNQLKIAYVSHNGGHGWAKVAAPPFGGYLAGASMTAGGTVFLSGDRMDVYISRDRGRTWTRAPSLNGAAGTADAGGSLTATAVTNTFGVTVQTDVTSHQLYLTRTAGRTWTAVTVP